MVTFHRQCRLVKLFQKVRQGNGERSHRKGSAAFSGGFSPHFPGYVSRSLNLMTLFHRMGAEMYAMGEGNDIGW